MTLNTSSRQRARSSDPVTSHLAAARVDEFADGHKQKIVAVLKACGPMTVDEIAKRVGLTSWQINKRCSELQRGNRIEPTGETRLSASGRPERVWRAVE